MKHYFFIILAVYLPFSICFAQTNLPPVYQIKSDTPEWQQIEPEYWVMQEDKGNQMKFEDVVKLFKAGKFHNIDSGYDSTVHTYWIVYRLHNAMSRDARVSLNSMSDFDEFYVQVDSAGWRHFYSGKLNEWEKKDGLKSADCIPIVMLPNETNLVYQRISNVKPGLGKDFMVAILGTEKAIKEYYIDRLERRETYFDGDNLLEAFIIGMIFLAAFMNFFFYRIVNEKVYLYFALFALFLGINRCYGISYSYFLVFNLGKLQYVPILGYAWVFISFFLIQFFRYFLGTQNKFKWFDKWFFRLITIFLSSYLLLRLLRLFQVKVLLWIGNLSSIVLFLVIPATLLFFQVLCLKHSGKENRFVFLGSLPLLLLYFLSQFFTPEGFIYFPNNPLSSFFALNFRLVEAVCLAVMLVTFTWVLFMRFIDLRKENAQQALDKERLAKEKEIERSELIARQKIQLERDVAERTTELMQSLDELKSTQAQLIQSEKMASLGELTAGIAHEIQNPLNFVNNFSEVSKELIDELVEEVEKGNTDEVKLIAKDVQQNLEKINHHGKRADAIVKGMLAHSRTNTGQKEPTDINALCDEYLRLAYHGLKAKDQSFNASFQFEPDSNIPKLDVVAQDIGRVLLNLINNAFQAVSGYTEKPFVTVSTRKLENLVEIRVADNGPGIPELIKDKIFQPFFTTKPAGQGTGLGLSLSYDIVKAHGGALKVETKGGEGSVFIIQLDINNS